MNSQSIFASVKVPAVVIQRSCLNGFNTPEGQSYLETVRNTILSADYQSAHVLFAGYKPLVDGEPFEIAECREFVLQLVKSTPAVFLHLNKTAFEMFQSCICDISDVAVVPGGKQKTFNRSTNPTWDAILSEVAQLADKLESSAMPIQSTRRLQ